MNNLKTVVAFAVGSLFAGAAFAQSNYSIEQRDRIEQARIDRGVASGQLTSREADRLQDGRAQIERMESRARSDGTLTRNERARIDGAQDRLSRDIYRESRDRQASNGSGREWNNRGDNRGNHNGWDNRGNNRGNHNGWGRGNERGNEHAARGQGVDHRNVNGGGRIDSHQNGWTPRSDTTTPAQEHSRARAVDRSGGRQASMPQAQARSTQSTPRATRQVAAARQGGDSGRRTR
jgi:hypothetical protein